MFECPCNASVLIEERCPITECPYNFEKTKDIFNSSNKVGCFLIDEAEISDRIINSRNKLTAMIRNSGKKISQSALTKGLEEVEIFTKTLLELMEIPSINRCYCGRKKTCKEKTPSCEAHRVLIDQIIACYNLNITPSRVIQANLLLEAGKLTIPNQLKVEDKLCQKSL